MILAGLDEAGYGPLLGPLVVGCCALRLEGEEAAAAALCACEDDGELRAPCVWKRLRKLLSKNRLRSGRKLHVNDSKIVYNPNLGLKELERSVLTLANCAAPRAGSAGTAGPIHHLEALLERVAPHVLADLPGYAWYAPPPDEPFPIENDPASVGIFANALRQEMDKSATHCVHLAARVVLERQLNALLAGTRNKSNALFSVAAIHLDQLIRRFGEQGLIVFCDRQGARDHYGRALLEMFPDWSLEILREIDGVSDYRLRRGPHVVRLVFCEKAETQCLPVAVASMLSKYLREALMRRFNAYWQAQLPQLEPTAGYYSDGTRFLRDIQGKREELGIADDLLVRAR
jgi:hypothetical protein